MFKSTYYDFLGVGQEADLEAISAAYLRLKREVESRGEEDASIQLQRLKRAFDVLSDPAQRAAYDARLASPPMASQTFPQEPLHVELEVARSTRHPIRILLTIIATVMVVGLVIQVGVMFSAYRRMNDATGGKPPAAVADKAYLQDFYQTYGIRAASREEAELLLADMKRKEQEGNAAKAEQRQREEQERALRRFEEESRREGRMVTATNIQAEEELRRKAEYEARRQEEQKRQAEEAERRKLDYQMERLRSRYGRDD